MSFNHVPVLYQEVIDALNVKPDGIYVDGTVGGVGHASGVAQLLNENGTLVAVDRDQTALSEARSVLDKYSCTKIYIHDNYSNLPAYAEELGGVDGILLDIGVSSYQLDTPERGFSYMNDAPLDMRMDESDAFTAYEIVNAYPESELFRVIKDYGEEKWASRIAKFIVNARAEAPIETTYQLVDIIKAAIPASARREGPHPAKRTFQALRIEVNGELSHLKAAVEALPDMLNSGGRLAIITFHSLEDRIVKEAFARRLDPCTCPKELPVCVCGKVADVKRVTKKPIVASKHELAENPRARSAKLRVIEKL